MTGALRQLIKASGCVCVCGEATIVMCSIRKKEEGGYTVRIPA